MLETKLALMFIKDHQITPPMLLRWDAWENN